ncbi:MAG: adenine deaminase [Methanomicrobiales archaeon]|nr:adenine deaminase [Methanomicrobiales archaeon]
MPDPAPAQQNPDSSPKLYFSNCELFNPCTCSWDRTSFTVCEGRIRTLGETRGFHEDEENLRGARVIPGLIDAHVHVESSLLCPTEFGRLVLLHGVTTVVADPHEIANVLGVSGIRYMLDEEKNTPLDIFFMLPSCVPASSEDLGGAIIGADDLALLLPHERVLGLGEVMDIEAVLDGDPGMMKKLRLTRLVDGHAPQLRGEALDLYLGAGIDSDHECTDQNEAREKLEKGMFIMIREGSTARNLQELIPLATACSLPRLSFATDDRHASTLARDGSIDDCVRRALQEGIELEVALRMATLSPCDRFMLRDRGILAPGKIADFCVLAKDNAFQVVRTYKEGLEVTRLPFQEPNVVRHTFHTVVPTEKELELVPTGKARVIEIQKGQILTREKIMDVEGGLLPDPVRDILTLLVCSRYRPGANGVGMVHGFGLREGALASSVAHDAHNVVAVGADTHSLQKAVRAVSSHNGGMAVVSAEETWFLPLECAGLMSSSPYEQVCRKLDLLEEQAHRMGAFDRAFMYLSFLTLTVVPELRLTERGLYNAVTQRRVPLFIS